MCVVGKKKKERHGVHGWLGKKWGVGYTCMMGKKGEWKKKEENKSEREKLNWFYLYVHFIWCKV